ncbi:hypothetical protein GCM10011611_39170 [Aliidongia dinghuensis]|uniref:DUF3757 domain-containing protein n=1 Tax=Aliidongia dinghuensis TaxID=1867774 RepID=A0A8J3E4Q6_9PROT|nr:hypothetical protein [Aliidongia dinghuensis]GGF29293.1 hypothetical protein GCM10011611_39170 [Aliidongia dinghuensis]
MKYALWGAAFAAATSLGTAAFADDGQFGCPAQGTTLTLSVGPPLTFGPASGFDCPHGGGFQHAGFSNQTSSAGVKEALEKLWPLKVGNKASADVSAQGARSTHGTYSCEVLGRESVTVHAGKFDAFKVKCAAEFPQERYQDERVYWWSPEVKYSVKFDYQLIQGSAFGTTPLKSWELVSIAH